MCVPQIYSAANTPQPKPAAQQTSEGVAQATPDVWQTLAAKGGAMGMIARQKLQTPQTYPSITKR